MTCVNTSKKHNKAFRNLMDRRTSNIKSTEISSPTTNEYKKRREEREKKLVLKYDYNISNAMYINGYD